MVTNVMHGSNTPVVLVILDGWGERKTLQGNAIATAKTPVIDRLRARYPHTLLQASGRSVGLPEGQMGNSEVGHLSIGAGRVIPQELVRISDSIQDGSLFKNHELLNVCQAVQQSGGKLHLVGLCSSGGVHAHIDHLFALLKVAKIQGLSEVCIHVITDGRDRPPTEGVTQIQRLQDYIDYVGIGHIVTLSGRYYAMDRNQSWERTQRAYEVMTQDEVGHRGSATQVLVTAYTDGITDEFLPPIRIAPGAIESGDGVIFFNFRPDRARQLTQAFVEKSFHEFDRGSLLTLHFATFTQYKQDLPLPVVFAPQTLKNTLGEVIAKRGLRQFRIAETEKYAHVTYFFNGGIEAPWTGEERLLIPSPGVKSYDLAPEMSAEGVTTTTLAAIEKQIYSLIVVNYANPDMVGHTGKMAETIQAVETVDRCLGQLLEGISQAGGSMIVTADHGNAERMNDEQGRPWPAHTTEPVPLILVRDKRFEIGQYGLQLTLAPTGCLTDIAPTILELLNVPQPTEMKGQSLLRFTPVSFSTNLSLSQA